MLTCFFEDGGKASLRHVVTHAIVIKDNQILLVKRAPFLLEGNKWSLPSGYVDRDETLEESVLRELKEETGWEGEVISFFRIISSPHRRNDSERQNVAVEYIIKPIKLVGTPDHESIGVEWFDLDHLPEELAFDHGESIEMFKKRKYQ